MSFPPMPGYDTINLVSDLEPVAAVRDGEIGERMRAYPRLLPAGSPDFGFAEQRGREWRVRYAGATEPSEARHALGRHLRGAAAGAPDAAGLLAAAGRLDPEDGAQDRRDDWPVRDRRFRIIRIEKFTLLGDRTMEPPRPTDDAPAADPPLADHLLDPRAPAGQWEAQLRLNLIAYTPLPPGVPPAVREEAREAMRTHPGLVLLPPTFTVVEVKGAAWEPLTGGSTPRQAVGNLAGYFIDLLPRLRAFRNDPPTGAELAEWARASAEIRASSGHDIEVIGRRFRVVRVSRLIRLGRDGPEGTRPSDQDRCGADRGL
ncbi:DUF5954 family protein [Spirillospora albida]|uniref:DUF5954 family protein n=1 Tax=Spirillospora albida TaxID=58123 RepID=UPI000689D4EC|nr:DUF5954 family protein [Spirillospora albida]